VDRFHIVVLGTAFRADLGLRQYADLIAVRLLNVKPFDSVADRINVWKVTRSTDSSVTFPGVRGTPSTEWRNFQDVLFQEGTSALPPGSSPRRVGPRRSREAAQVRILIVNYDFDGGRGSHADRTVFIPCTGPTRTARSRRRSGSGLRLVTHECGHAVADSPRSTSAATCTLGEQHPEPADPQGYSELAVKWTLALRRAEP
jgi:hypothetical protein